MDKRQLEILKSRLEEEGFDPSSWEDLLVEASIICSIFADVMKQTEPYAKTTISALKDTSEMLLTAAEC